MRLVPIAMQRGGLRSPQVGANAQRGQILVIVAGGFLVLLAIAALVIEGGTLVLNRRDAQNAADLAALAGARIVAANYTDGGRTQGQVWTEIDRVAGQNQCVPGSGAACDRVERFVGAGLVDLGPVAEGSSAALPNGTLGVRVSVTRHPEAVLGRIPPISRQTWDVNAEGTAISTKPTGVPAGAMLPIVLCGYTNYSFNPPRCEPASQTPPNAIDFQPGVIYDLTDGKDGPGGFGWLSWDGSNSAGALAQALCTPSNPMFSLDSPYDDPGLATYNDYLGTNPTNGETWFPIDPGKSNKNDVRKCLDDWIASGATVLIPIYDIFYSPHGGGNTAWYHITGVAAFVLTSREQPAVDQIQGRFIEYYPYTDIPGNVGTEPPDPGDTTVFVGLVR